MNTSTIKKLRKKFIMIAMISFFVVMAVTGLLINTANIFLTRSNVSHTLDYIIENDGNLPTPTRSETEKSADQGVTDKFTREFRYTTRYFAVIENEQNGKKKTYTVNLDHIATVSKFQAIDYVNEVRNLPLANYRTFGKYRDFYYKIGKTSSGQNIAVFVDSSNQIAINTSIMEASLVICGLGALIAFIIIYKVSMKAIRPEIENARRQKQFITNASHELKTPLAVIRANTEVSEMIHGEDEWSKSTMRQVDRLNALIQNLVMITRAQEQEDRSVLAEVNVSDLVKQSCDPYDSLAQQEEKKFLRNIQSDVKMVADGSKIQQLVSLLVDNAFKYCDDKGTIAVSLDTQKSTLKSKKSIRLCVSNNYADGASVDYTRFFERFYRQDESRAQDSSKGGFGIGLSIAESIVQSYSGSISASWKDGIITFTCILPG